MSVAIVDRLVEAHNGRSVDAVLACYGPGANVFMDGWDQPINVPTWLTALDSLRESFPDLAMSRGPAASGEGLVIAEIRMVGTNTGPLNLGAADRLLLHTDAERLPPTGRSMDVVGLVVLEHDGRQVTAERHYWPMVGWLVQLGLVSVGEPVA